MSVLRELREDALGAALRLGLLTLVLSPGLGWRERVPVLVLAGAGLISPTLARSAPLWFSLAVVTAVRLVTGWPLSDNHDYLRSLLCLAAGVALVTPQPRPCLARSARLMLGLVFAFATLWKGVLSPDFVDGTFFRVTLLEDSRFANLAILAGGMSDAAFDANDEALVAHAQGVAWAEAGFLEPAASRRLAVALVVFTLAIEAGLALAFLWPGAARLRDALLLLFVSSTFAFATVAGFAWLLLALGFAQCEPERTATRAAYLAVFFLVIFYEWVPWSDALAAGFQAGFA